MAETEYAVNHPSAVKLWHEKLFREALKDTKLAPFIGSGSDSMIQKLMETSKGAGDKITYTLRSQLSGNGVEGDATLEGNEEALTHYTDSLVINQLRNAVLSAGKMSEQRVPWKVRNEAMLGLKDWWSARIETSLFNQLAGNTAVSDSRLLGHNAVTAPDANHIVYPDGDVSEADVNSSGASSAMNLKWIDYAVEKAKTATNPIRPIRVNGENKYVLFLHTYATTSLRTNTNTGQWLDIQKAAMQGGQISKNPIYTNALGEYHNVILHESTYVPAAPSLANVRRNILCGAQAATIAFGENYGGADNQRWVEKLFDYDNKLGVSAGFIWGCKRTIFNSESFGTIVIPTYSPANA